MATLPNKIYVANTTPDHPSVVNQNYPGAVGYVRIDKVINYIKAQLGHTKRVRGSELHEGYAASLEDVWNEINAM